LAVALSPVAMLAACNEKDKTQAVPDTPKSATPVPSDLVFNDFLPQGATGAGLGVRGGDGGLDGALASASGGEPGAEPTENAEKFKVLEQGAEPRAVRKYQFAGNKPEKRTLTIRQSMSQGGRGQEQPALAMTVEFVVKESKPKATKFEMKVVKVDLADKDKVDPRMVAQAAQEFAAFAGLAATFDVAPNGEVGEVAMSGTDKMQKEGAPEMLQALQQFVELILAPLPTTAIGVGAKWEGTQTLREGGIEQTAKRTLELKELTEGGATIVSTLEKKVPRRAIPDPRMPKGSTMELDGTGTYTYAVRFDRIATKVAGDQTNTVKIEVLDPKSKEKKNLEQIVKIKHVLESAGGGGGGGSKPAASGSAK
jgi:hypothetical protein